MSFFRELLIKIKGDTKDFQSKTKQVEQQTGKIEKGMNRLAAAMAATFSIAVIANFLKKAVSGYQELERAQAKVIQGLKSTGNAAGFTSDQMFSLARELEKITKVDEQEILNQVTAQLITFTNVARDEFKRAHMAALDLATVLDGDLKSASIMVGKALNDPTQGLLAMRRVGISFSDSQVKVINSLVETNKLADAQSLILDELNRQYGGQAAAAGKLSSGPLKDLGFAFDALTDSMGEYVVKSNFWTKSLQAFTDAFEHLATKFETVDQKAKKESQERIDRWYAESKSISEWQKNALWDINMVQKLIEGMKADKQKGLTKSELEELLNEIEIQERVLEGLLIAVRDFDPTFFDPKDISPAVKTIEDLRNELAALKENKEFLPVSATNQIAQVNDQIQELESRIKALDELSILRKDLSLAPLEAIPPAMLAVKDATDEARESMDKWVAGWTENAMPEIEAVIQNFDMMLQDFLTDSVATFAEGIGTALSGQGSFEDGLNNLLIMVADWAGNFGKLLIAAGFAASSFQKTLATNPPLAIAAGAALVAAASLVKGALSQNPMKGKGSSGASGGSRRDSGDFLEGFRQLTPDLRVTVDGRIVASGSQLAVVLENETRRRNF